MAAAAAFSLAGSNVVAELPSCFSDVPAARRYSRASSSNCSSTSISWVHSPASSHHLFKGLPAAQFQFRSCFSFSFSALFPSPPERFWERGVSSRDKKQRFASAGVARASAGKKEVLIVNTHSGGHAAIGFYFAKDLVGAGHGVTVFTVGKESSDKNKKPPFSRFSELRDIGVKNVWGDSSDIAATVGGAKYDVVLDNSGKDLDAVKPVADWAKATGAQQFLFISSAGIYKVTNEPPHVEGDAVKGTAGHAVVEDYLKTLGFESWASFRPQYMTGSGNNKDCEEWFFDRIVRGRPVPIPEPGLQLTNIARISDVAEILTLAVQKPDAANGQIFNAVSDRAVTLAGLARLSAKAAGKDVEVVLYDPKAVGVEAKKAFPFRITHFYAEPRAAKELLGFVSKTYLPDDLKERYEEYVKTGRDKKDLSSKFELDDKILEALKQPVTV